MADEVEMTPVEMTPVEAAEPPKSDPLAKPAAPISDAAKAPRAVPKPAVGAGALKPGLKLPPKPAVGAGALKPGLKLPPKPAAGAGALKPGLKLPPKPAVGAGALKPGLKLPTQNAARPVLPPKPVIRKPGATVMAQPLPKPITPQKPAAETPVAVDAQGVGKLPTVEAKAISRDDSAPVVSENPRPLEALKSVTHKLKGITQEIPQQAILRKTGIIAEDAMSDAQKSAAKHKTARISLSDAIGVAPVKNENAPIKTIRIKRPVGIPGDSKPQETTPPAPAPADAEAKPSQPAAESAEPAKGASSPTETQRKTLKITRPGGGALRPAGKFGIKRPGAARPQPAAQPAAQSGGQAAGEVANMPEVADIPDMPAAPAVPMARPPADNGPAWLWTLSSLVQLAACVAMAALAWFLYVNTQTSYF